MSILSNVRSWLTGDSTDQQWRTVAEWRNECVRRGMDGRHSLAGIKHVVGQVNEAGERRIKILSSPRDFPKRSGEAWERAEAWQRSAAVDTPFDGSIVGEALLGDRPAALPH
jgi:hypothetical protein